MHLPESFITRAKAILQDDFSLFLEALDKQAPVSIRVNDKIEKLPSEERVAWCPSGFYLRERPLFTTDPLFHAGAYYVQEASSMFLYQALKQYVSRDSLVLDLSAAPGGKSTLISQFLSENGFLVSNEIIRSRAHILTENLIKWGNDNFLVSNNAPVDFQSLPSFFDVVVVDAPCSGEGMFRKDPEAIKEWSEENVVMCATRQQEILNDVWDSLKTGGTLIYSTCTYNKEENEKNVEWIIRELGAEFLPLDISSFPEITATDYGYRFFPHKTRGEGFFLSVLRKTSESTPFKFKKKDKKEIKQTPSTSLEILRKQLLHPDVWDITQEENLVSATRKAHTEKTTILKKTLKVLHAGITLAEQKGHDFIPHISLALSKSLDKQTTKTVEVDKTTALQFLKRESINLPAADKGYILLTFQSVPIGWVKNVGNRCNNLYPTHWKIRMKIDE